MTLFLAFLAGVVALGLLLWLAVHLLGRLGLLASRHDPQMQAIERELAKLMLRCGELEGDVSRLSLTLHQMGAESPRPVPQQEVFDSMPGS